MVIKFDLNTIPNNVTVTKAALSMYPYEKFMDGENGPKSVYRVTKEWDESSVTWKSPWSTSGGDYDTVALSSNNNSSYNVWEEYDLTTAVKNIVEEGGDNYGFIFIFDSMTPPKGATMYSSEASDITLRPKLTVEYTSSVKVISIPTLTNLPTGPYRVSIVNLLGREIASGVRADITYLNSIKKSLPKGIFIVRIHTPENEFFQMKWLIK